jgi:hypothetical protein
MSPARAAPEATLAGQSTTSHCGRGWFGVQEYVYKQADENGRQAKRNERAMSRLSDQTGAALPEVRDLYAQEFLRLERGATVRSFLEVLTASNVRSMIRRSRTHAAAMAGIGLRPAVDGRRQQVSTRY